MINIEMAKEDGSWTVRVADTVQVSGFTEEREAAIWVLEYLSRTLLIGAREVRRKEKREERRKLIGAALLAVPERKS